MVVQGRARGGLVRAAKLSKEERSAIAKKAAAERWSDEIPVALCGSPDHPLRIGEVEIPCYVLDDETRVLTQAGFLEALGRHPKASVRRRDSEGFDADVPPLLQGKTLRPFISPEVLEKSRPITFKTPVGLRASGYRADLLPEICEVYLRARDAEALHPSQSPIAKRAEILVRGLAHVGIIALVDEATGYQDLRKKNALAEILEAFIAKELQAWVRTFPDDFYRHIFRLRGLNFPADPVKRPQYFGGITNDIVYRRIAPGVLDELKRVTARSASGRPRHKYFQLLTSNHGYPKLREHLGSVVTLMKLSREWPDFMDKLDQIHPKFNATLPLPFPYDEQEDDGKGL